MSKHNNKHINKHINKHNNKHNNKHINKHNNKHINKHNNKHNDIACFLRSFPLQIALKTIKKSGKIFTFPLGFINHFPVPCRSDKNRLLKRPPTFLSLWMSVLKDVYACVCVRVCLSVFVDVFVDVRLGCLCGMFCFVFYLLSPSVQSEWSNVLFAMFADFWNFSLK